MKKKVIIPTIALVAILGAIALSPVPASAQDPTYSTLVTKIAQRFGLPEADVQQVVKEVRAEHMSSLKTKWEDRLSQAVSDGKITETQKQALIANIVPLRDDVRNSPRRPSKRLAMTSNSSWTLPQKQKFLSGEDC